VPSYPAKELDYLLDIFAGEKFLLVVGENMKKTKTSRLRNIWASKKVLIRSYVGIVILCCIGMLQIMMSSKQSLP